MNVQLAARINDTFLFEIGSFTYKNLNYDLTVSPSGHVETCTCADRKYRPSRPNGCKHMKALQAEINAKKAQTAKAEKRAQDERIQAQAQAIIAKRFAELEAQREAARKSGGWSFLR